MTTRNLRGWLCLVGLVTLGSCKSGSAPSPSRLNLLLVTIDTLRADRLGCYGYSQIETPNLDRIARQGVLFENAVAPTPLTAPSHASMMTGVYPTVHKVRNTGGFVLVSIGSQAGQDPTGPGMGHGGIRRVLRAERALWLQPGVRRIR